MNHELAGIWRRFFQVLRMNELTQRDVLALLAECAQKECNLILQIEEDMPEGALSYTDDSEPVYGLRFGVDSGTLEAMS